MDDLPFSQACENNKTVILDVLKRYLEKTKSLLEIGGGTGQHAVFFAEKLPHLNWQSSDIPENVANLNLRLAKTSLANTPAAISLNVDEPYWTEGSVLENSSSLKGNDAIFTANTLHIMSANSVENFFQGIGSNLAEGGVLLVYGPFKYNGEFTSQSNAEFDLWLKDRNPVSGVRDFETVNGYAEKAGLALVEDISMPANNQLLVWLKRLS